MLEEIAEPEDARGAIAVGLNLTNAGQYDAAIGIFEKALSLPGTGLKQFRHATPLSIDELLQRLYYSLSSLICAIHTRDKPPAISNGEKQAALYNIACCYSRLGNLENSLRALASALWRPSSSAVQISSLCMSICRYFGAVASVNACRTQAPCMNANARASFPQMAELTCHE